MHFENGPWEKEVTAFRHGSNWPSGQLLTTTTTCKFSSFRCYARGVNSRAEIPWAWFSLKLQPIPVGWSILRLQPIPVGWFSLDCTYSSAATRYNLGSRNCTRRCADLSSWGWTSCRRRPPPSAPQRWLRCAASCLLPRKKKKRKKKKKAGLRSGFAKPLCKDRFT